MPRTFAIEVPRARLWGPAAVPIASNDTLLADLSNDFGKRVEQQAIMHRTRLGRPRALTGVTATIAGYYSDSYPHWMTDLLPRINLLQRAGVEYDQIVVPATHKFHDETLTAAGVPPEKRVAAGPTLECDTLWVPSKAADQGQSPAASCHYVRALFKEQIEDQPQKRRLYLSRGDVDRRRAVNDDEVVEFLAPLGFESFVGSGKTVAQQAQLFAQAEVIVALHGGAMTNIVFCQPGTKVVEIFSPGFPNVCHWTLAYQQELDYFPVFSGDGVPRPGVQWANFEVDLGRVASALRSLGVS